MRQNATPAKDPLSPNQERALAALLAGKSVTEAAAVAEVDRTTLHRWLKEDFDFGAALNRGRKDLREAMHARLMVLAAKAAGCVEKALDNGDDKVALALLKGIGLLSGEPPKVGSDDPQRLAVEARRNALFNSF
jgi:hypothetical protein